MSEPDYIVIEGKWLDLSQRAGPPPGGGEFSGVKYHPTGRFELRDDGAVAEIWAREMGTLFGRPMIENPDL